MKRALNSKVMTIANRLVKHGVARSAAMVKAWVLVKLASVETRVAGVTYERRQEAIEHLAHYSAEEITITLKREPENRYDRNAIAVVAAVMGKGRYCMGYLPRGLAAFVAPIMDKGQAVQSYFKGVRGYYGANMNYGLAIGLKI